jgi:iron(III) transport system permease protein
VTLPNLRPAIAAGSILVALYALSDFGAVSILRFDSLTSVIYTQYRSSFDRSAAAALSLLLVGLALCVVVLEGFTRGRAAYYSRARRAPTLVALGRWRWPALAFCGVVAFMGVVLPLLVIGYWAVRGLAHGESGQISQGPIVNSVWASTLAALATVAAALPVAFLAVRYRGRVSALLERLTYAGFALPGIAIALSLVFFAANYTPWLYQSMALLVFGYTVRFLPEAVGASRSALLQVNPKTEEAARGLGAGPIRTLAQVTAPQILPGLSAGGLLVFLTAMKELPLTLLLSQIGFQTLATQIWTATNEAFFTRAAFASLILVGVSGVAVYLMLRREGYR